MVQAKEYENAPFIVLGYPVDPMNSLLVESPRFCPSKLGGKPCYLNPKDTPVEKCSECQYNLVFLGQLYADLPSHDYAFKRTLYIFACVSPNCIQLGRAFAFRCLVPDKAMQWANDEDFDYVMKKTDQDLMTTQYGDWVAELDEEYDEEDYQKPEKADKIILEEYFIETGPEKTAATMLYLEHAGRLAKQRQ
jgi:pre-rRNA-processing protein TSR4